MSPITIISLMHIAAITRSILKHAVSGLVSFVNFRGPEDNPFDSATNFQKFFLHKILNILSLPKVFSLSNKHLLSLYWSCNNMAKSSLLPNVLSLF